MSASTRRFSTMTLLSSRSRHHTRIASCNSPTPRVALSAPATLKTSRRLECRARPSLAFRAGMASSLLRASHYPCALTISLLGCKHSREKVGQRSVTHLRFGAHEQAPWPPNIEDCLAMGCSPTDPNNTNTPAELFGCYCAPDVKRSDSSQFLAIAFEAAVVANISYASFEQTRRGALALASCQARTATARTGCPCLHNS